MNKYISLLVLSILFPMLIGGCGSLGNEIATITTAEEAPIPNPQENLPGTIIVTETTDDGPGSFRQALQDAQPGDTITFDPIIFPPNNPATITVLDELPHIRESYLTIDASNSGVILDGSQISGDWVSGLQIVSSDECAIMGLQVSHFPGPGIAISGEAENNKIGGNRSLGDGPFGQGNLLSKNVIGIDLSLAGNTLNTVTGNLIGTDLDDSGGLGNDRYGVMIGEGAYGNIIGPNNIIAYNGEGGIYIESTDESENTVAQNNIYGNGPDNHEEMGNGEIQPKATVIFYNGTILTIDNNLPQAESLAVQENLILAVGSDEEMLAYQGTDTELVDLKGLTLLPGFVDPHTHVLNDIYDQDYERAQALALENGITSLANMFAPEEFVQDLQRFEEAGNLRVRTSVYLLEINNCGEPQGGWYKAYPPTDEFGEMLRIGGVKLFTDGGTCGAAAVSEVIYSGWDHGDLWASDEEFNAVVREADDAGYQVAIHAIGDRGVDQAIDALNAVIDTPGNPERHRIEHVTYLRDEQFSRFSEKGINPVIFGNSPACYMAENEQYFTENLPLMFRRIRELVDANPGLIIAAKTDYPWRGPLGPLHELYSLTTAKEVSKEGIICEPPPWLSTRVVTIEEALPMVTINAAYMLFRDDEVGSLEPGKLADLIILSGNPLTVEPNEIKDIDVLMTMVGGQTEYCASEQEEFCPVVNGP